MDELHTYLKQERGRLSRLAEALDVAPSNILQWKCVPAHRVLAIEEHTGISRHVLRPDVYGKPIKVGGEPIPSEGKVS